VVSTSLDPLQISSFVSEPPLPNVCVGCDAVSPTPGDGDASAGDMAAAPLTQRVFLREQMMETQNASGTTSAQPAAKG
jgi:hypothetical protein